MEKATFFLEEPHLELPCSLSAAPHSAPVTGAALQTVSTSFSASYK